MAAQKALEAPEQADSTAASTDPLAKPLASAADLPSNILLESCSTGPSMTLSPDLWLNQDPDSPDTYLDMFWIDAFETNGDIYVFGKVAPFSCSGPRHPPLSPSKDFTTAVLQVQIKAPPGESSSQSKFVSCCVVVKNVMRSMFVLPRATDEVDEHGNPRRCGLAEVTCPLLSRVES